MSEEILTAIYGVFEPFRPPIREAYVDCQEVRGRWNVLRQLGRKITRSGDQPTCQLFTGYGGVGKSTELLRLQEELEKQKFFVVYFAASQDDIEQQDTELADILFACTRHLLQIQSIKLEGNVNPLRLWAANFWEELKSLGLSEIKLEDLSFETPENLFTKIATTLRAVPDKRRQLRDKLNSSTPSLIAALNKFIRKAKRKLAKEGFKDIVIIVDNLDRIAEKKLESGRLTNLEEIYLNCSTQIKSLNCHAIYTVPISLAYSNWAIRLSDMYGKLDVLPMIMVRNLDHSVNQQGLDKLREIIRQRIQIVDRKMQSQYADSLDTSFFASSEVLDSVCLMSGGRVQSLIHLIWIAIKYIDKLPITMKAAQTAIEEMRSTYLDAIQDNQWDILAATHRNNQIERNEEYIDLLLNRCLLAYHYWNGKLEEVKLTRWYDIHPLIESLPKFTMAIQKLDKVFKKTDLCISKVELNNIRCFKNLQLDFADKDKVMSKVMILGDNAAGKTTLLRSIAVGLCSESDAAALIRKIPGEFLRQNEDEGFIRITLCDSKNYLIQYSITTKIHKNNESNSETIQQKTDPIDGFPWDAIFVCAYGAQRSSQADASHQYYEVLASVSPLFDYNISLQNPELIMLRQSEEVQKSLKSKLLSILMVDPLNSDFLQDEKGLHLNNSWGKHTIQSLSDGYRSTTQWILDFMSWAIYAKRLSSNQEIGGILLIDEIEQHLHPRWQRYILQRIHEQFPKTQIIATTHTPLIAAGVVDIDNSMLMKLNVEENGLISHQIINQDHLKGKRADQILTSDAFGLPTTRNLRSENDLDRFSALLGKEHRTSQEELEFQILKTYVQEHFSTQESPIAQIVEKAVDKILHEMTENISPELIDIETKRYLQDLSSMET